MASNNPHGLQDGMLVRKVSAPTKLFRVSGDPDAGRATFVAMSKGERTVLNGNARNYRPETSVERAEREGVPREVETPAPVPTGDAPFVLRSVPAMDVGADDDADDDGVDSVDADIAELCARVSDAVLPLAAGRCSPTEAAALVLAAAELNAAVVRGLAAEDDAN